MLLNALQCDATGDERYANGENLVREWTCSIITHVCEILFFLARQLHFKHNITSMCYKYITNCKLQLPQNKSREELQSTYRTSCCTPSWTMYYVIVKRVKELYTDWMGESRVCFVSTSLTEKWAEQKGPTDCNRLIFWFLSLAKRRVSESVLPECRAGRAVEVPFSGDVFWHICIFTYSFWTKICLRGNLWEGFETLDSLGYSVEWFARSNKILLVETDDFVSVLCLCGAPSQENQRAAHDTCQPKIRPTTDDHFPSPDDHQDGMQPTCPPQHIFSIYRTWPVSLFSEPLTPWTEKIRLSALVAGRPRPPRRLQS